MNFKTQSLFVVLAFGQIAFGSERRLPQYLLKLPTEEIVYVDAPQPFSYGFNAYYGQPGQLKPLQVMNVNRRRDGGTTTITLAEGSIFVPSPLNRTALRQSRSDLRSSPRSFGTNEIGPSVTIGKMSSAAVLLEVNEKTLAEYQIDVAHPAGRALLVAPAEATHQPGRILDVKDALVKHAFRDDDGNLLIEFEYGAKNLGINTIFWGPRGTERLHQMRRLGYKGNGVTYEMTIAAPSVENSERSLKIQSNESGILAICDHKTQCFRPLTEAEVTSLNSSIRAGQFVFESLPDVRRVEYVFKIDGTEDFIVIDAPELQASYDFEVWIGPKGRLEPLEIADVSRLRDGGTTFIELADGRTVFSPSSLRPGHPVLFASKDDQTGRPITPQAENHDVLRALGYDLRRLKMSELKTPASGDGRCSVFLDQP